MQDAVVLDAAVAGDRAIAAVAHLAPGAAVVVRFRRALATSHVALTVDEVRARARPDVPLGDVLDLAGATPLQVWDPDTDPDPPDGPAVVFDPDGLATLHPGPARAATPQPEAPRAPRAQRQQQQRARRRRPTATPGGRPAARRADRTPWWKRVRTPRSERRPRSFDPGDGAPDVEAYPRFEVPDTVVSEARFRAVVGLDDVPGPEGADAAMSLTAVGPTFDMDVQLVAEGFTVEGSARQRLHVSRDDLAAAEVTFELVAPAVTAPHRAKLEVQYAHGGLPVGRAWHEVIVSPGTAPENTTVGIGASPVAIESGDGQVDLTVVAVASDLPGTLLWTFFAPSAVDLPTDPVARDLQAASAEAFATQQVITLGRSAGSDLESQELEGVSRIIADVLPPDFWRVLADVAGVLDRPPTILFVTSDPWIPWELASTDADYLPPEVVDQDVPAFLGAQFVVGRWLQPARVGRVERPMLPPPTTHAVSRLCLVVGDYAAAQGLRPLPEAIEEGEHLERTYPSVRRTATAKELVEVFEDQVRDDGQEVEISVLHMACHGQLDPTNTRWSGIVLAPGEGEAAPSRFTATMVRGSELTRRRRPFVFLNACQVGQATEGLGDFAGMPGAFVREGACGFVAPLWEVDDRLARQAAIDLYRAALEEDVSVGEALRRYRAAWGPGESSRLAYVYYGHPGLRLALIRDDGSSTPE